MAARRNASHGSLDVVGAETKSCTRGRRIGDVRQHPSATLPAADHQGRCTTFLEPESECCFYRNGWSRSRAKNLMQLTGRRNAVNLRVDVSRTYLIKSRQSS